MLAIGQILENQKDFMTRMEQFYDHYLNGAPAPDWMVNGVPYLQKRQGARALMEGRGMEEQT